MIQEFSQAVIEKLQYYVYVLRNPEDNMVFYVGKGTGNRVFERKNNDVEEMIQEIKSLNLNPVYQIVRYELTENEALIIESTLIDLFGLEEGQLKNKVYGVDSQISSVEEIEIQLGGEHVEINDDCILINVKTSFRLDMTEDEIYEITRKYWKIKLDRAQKYNLVLSIHKGIIRGVFENTKWKEDDNKKGRCFFTGNFGTKKLKSKYLHKKYEINYQNPIHYIKNGMSEIENVESGIAEMDANSIIIKINQKFYEDISKKDLYEITRKFWRIDEKKIDSIKKAYAVANGVVQAVYEVQKWHISRDSNRKYFDGIEINDVNVGKTIPEEYSKKGMAYPILYV